MLTFPLEATWVRKNKFKMELGFFLVACEKGYLFVYLVSSIYHTLYIFYLRQIRMKLWKYEARSKKQLSNVSSFFLGLDVLI